MPKLNIVDIYARVAGRIDELENGAEIDTRALNKLLTEKQQQQMADALAANKASKSKKRREVQLEVMQAVFEQLKDSFDDDWERYKEDEKVRGARVYMDAYFAAKKAGKNASAIANAALTTHGFKRLDGVDHSFKQSTRDMEVQQMEDSLRKRFEAEMTDDEREQQRILAEHEASLKKRGKA
jgi:hypothetical protein